LPPLNCAFSFLKLLMPLSAKTETLIMTYLFMLRVFYKEFIENKALQNFFVEQEDQGTFEWQEVMGKEQEAIYLIITTYVIMAALKRSLDANVHLTSADLFEYRSW
jgi:hypothetical protein